MKVLIDLPDVIRDADGNEYEATGEYRAPNKGDWHLWGRTTPSIACRDMVGDYIILRRKWTWPAWLKGWGIAMDANGTCYAFATKPELSIYTWHPDEDGAFFRWYPEMLGPPPPITDWTQPVLNPNYKGDV